MNSIAKSLAKKLKDIHSKTPLLIIGKAREIFKDNYKNKVYSSNEIEEIDTSNLYFLDLEEDISKINDIDISNAVVLIKNDLDLNYINVFNYVLKIVNRDNTNCSLVNIAKAIESFKVSEDSDEASYCSYISPEYYYLKKKSSSFKSNSKIINLLGEII